MTEPQAGEIRLLAPESVKPTLDSLHRDVIDASGSHVTRRRALGLGGMALLAMGAAACGTTSTSTGGGGATSGGASPSDTLAGKPLENHLEIFNWSQYDDPSTYTKFKAQPAVAAAGLTLHETYYSSNDELHRQAQRGRVDVRHHRPARRTPWPSSSRRASSWPSIPRCCPT